MGCTTSKGKDGDASSAPSDGATPTSRKRQTSFLENSSHSFSSRRVSGSSRKLDLDELKSNSAVTNSLTGLLSDAMGQKYFLRFCHAELSSENPEYWLAVQLFKKASEEDRTQVGLRVFHCFLKQNCTHPVNIPIGQSSRIEEELRECVDAKRQLPITIFDQSAGHAYKSMDQDTYRRFMSSSLCDELVSLWMCNAFKDEQCVALFRKHLALQPDGSASIERYGPRLRLWRDAVVAPAMAAEADRDAKLLAALEWALEQPVERLGLTQETWGDANRALKSHMKQKRERRMRQEAAEQAAGNFGSSRGGDALGPAAARAPDGAEAASRQEGAGGAPPAGPSPRGSCSSGASVVRKSDGGSSMRTEEQEEEEEMEMAALIARADGVDEAEMLTLTVRLDKASQAQKIGVVITCGGEWDSPLHVSKLRPNSLAANCGLLRLGDRLLAVNGEEVDHPVTATDMMRTAPGRLELVVKRSPPDASSDLKREDPSEAPSGVASDAPPAPPAAAAAATSAAAATATATATAQPSSTSSPPAGSSKAGEGEAAAAALEVDAMVGVQSSLLALATESLMSMEVDYLRFSESKQGDQYLSRLRVKRVPTAKTGTASKRPLDKLGVRPISLDGDDEGHDDGDYTAGW